MKRKQDFSSTSVKVVDQEEYTVFCEHGPCLLFERCKPGSSDISRFFACSVYRNRKSCSFYRSVTDKPKTSRIEFNKDLSVQHKLSYEKLKSVRKSPSQKRRYCYSCDQLILPEECTQHNGHKLENGITNAQLKNPTKLLTSLQDKDGEAQYWFSKSSVAVLSNIVETLKFEGVLCIGCPRFFELLNGAKCKKNVQSFLLDYDGRLANFWSPRLFAQYNMLADYFYAKKSSSKQLNRFFGSVSRLLIVVDPPFGALCCQIAKSVKSLRSKFILCKNLAEQKLADDDVHCGWVAPYFLEPKITENLPELKMTDYQVEYENHPLYKKSDKKRGSPIRLFTSIPLDSLKLPETHYRFCQKCDKYVVKSNLHCAVCNTCASKDGQTYVHCKSCERCVKPTYLHCKECKKCHLKGRCLDSENSKATGKLPKSKKRKLNH